MRDYTDLPEGKLALFWIFGSFAILFGAWIAGHVEKTIGTTTFSYAGALTVAFLLILFGGLAWIAVSINIMHHK